MCPLLYDSILISSSVIKLLLIITYYCVLNNINKCCLSHSVPTQHKIYALDEIKDIEADAVEQAAEVQKQVEEKKEDKSWFSGWFSSDNSDENAQEKKNETFLSAFGFDKSEEKSDEVKEISKTDEVIQEEIVMPREEIKKEKKRLDILDELEEIENNLPNKKDDVTNFEMEQERTAIISLDELLKKSEDLYSDNEVVQYDDGNEPISIDEVLKMFKKDDEEVQAVEEKAVPEVFQEVVEENKVQEQVEEKELYSKKETIPFISSIYGIEQDSNALEFENTATYEKLDRQNQNDFITQLREMNENK